MEKTIGYQLADISRQLRRLFDERVRDLDLTSVQARLLLSLARTPGENQAFYAERLEIEPITLTRIIDRMELAGWVERHPDPCDRRARLLQLTAKSQAVLAPLQSGVARLFDEMLSGIEPRERQALVDLLDRIDQNLVHARKPEAAHG